jgi:hypothetical protein
VKNFVEVYKLAHMHYVSNVPEISQRRAINQSPYTSQQLLLFTLISMLMLNTTIPKRHHGLQERHETRRWRFEFRLKARMMQE